MEQSNYWTKTDYKGLKGRKRLQSQNNILRRAKPIKISNDSGLNLYDVDSSSVSSDTSSNGSLDAKKLRLEDVLWDEAIGGLGGEVGDQVNLQGHGVCNVTVFNEDENTSSQVIVNSSSALSSTEGGL